MGPVEVTFPQRTATLREPASGQQTKYQVELSSPSGNERHPRGW